MKKTQEKGALNPDFKTTCYYDMKSLTKDEILNILKNNPLIYINFKKDGIITSKQYPFITKVTFNEFEKNCVENIKTEEEKKQAKENLKVVEDYFNSRYINDGNCNFAKPLKVAFASRKDNECALYNPNKHNSDDELNNKLVEIFGLLNF